MALLKILTRAQGDAPASARLTIPFDIRSRSRFKARLDNGEEVGVILDRGQILRGGDRLLAEDGRVVEIFAAPETVSTTSANDLALLARGAYHLGNRHVPLQLGPAWLRYGHDHVLDDMMRGLGFLVSVENLPFEPEAGAYHAHGASAGHAHDHHDHDHRHGPSHRH
jgi:urease accessory protein